MDYESGEHWEITWSGSSGRAPCGKRSIETMIGVKKDSSEKDVKDIWQYKNKRKKFISAKKIRKEIANDVTNS